jgi:eukaryotic-like serine/threonine-protein kinase
LGTPGYMSPEQFHGEDVDRRSDVWAFGCVMFELLSGRPAFADATSSDRARASLTQEPDWSRLPAEAPFALKKILKRCLAKDPAKRYQTCGASNRSIHN